MKETNYHPYSPKGREKEKEKRKDLELAKKGGHENKVGKVSTVTAYSVKSPCSK